MFYPHSPCQFTLNSSKSVVAGFIPALTGRGQAPTLQHIPFIPVVAGFIPVVAGFIPAFARSGTSPDPTIHIIHPRSGGVHPHLNRSGTSPDPTIYTIHPPLIAPLRYPVQCCPISTMSRTFITPSTLTSSGIQPGVPVSPQCCPMSTRSRTFT